MKQPEQHIIVSLLEKHALGILTPEERVLLEKWYADFPQEGRVWEGASEKAAMKAAMRAEIFDVIAPNKMQPVKPKLRWMWWPAAAVVAALVVVFLVSRKTSPAYIIERAPVGKGIVRMQLPDQSEMWLEPGTEVRYQADFGTGHRQIALVDGMAFFSVRGQSATPFLVSIPGGIQVKVLGTGFTVKKYAASPNVEVMVNSGAVQVADSTGGVAVLKAGQQLSFQSTISSGKRSDGVVADWRTGDLTVTDASVAEVARILERRYGLQVTFDAEHFTAYRLTFRIGREDTAADVLEMLKDISGIGYTLTGNRVIMH